MAEFEGLDELLSGSLKRAAQPGDSAGVADSIRARVAAGDTGTAGPSSGSAPGFGGGALSWIPWFGAIVVLGLVGGTLGVTGVLGHPVDSVTVSTASILMPPTVQGTSCPDGPVVASIERGARVVALARSADGAAVQVRNPANVSQLVWIPVGELVGDSGQGPVAGLPVGPACPTVTVEQAPVIVAPVAPVAPVVPPKPSQPKPPADTAKPTVGKPVVDNSANNNCYARVTVTASDNVGVASVSISWTGANTGSGQMTATAGHWQYIFQGTLSNTFSGFTTFTVVAHDAAGNSSAPSSSAPFSVVCLG